MSIKFACGCGKAYKVPDKFSGKRIKCKSCGEPIRVPSESESGVQSQRAAKVSKRSVLASQRVSKSSDGKSAKMSAKLKSKRLKSGRASGTSSRSSSKSARKSKRTKSAGSGTERFTPIDLVEGNAIKRFQKKRDGDEFPRGEGRVTYFENGKPKKAFKVNRKGATIGRDDGCSISRRMGSMGWSVTVPSDSVSSKHLKLEYKLGTFIATDLQSTNGIVLNGRSVRRASLKSGDVLQLGEAILRIDCG